MKKLRVFVGWDSKEDIAYRVCAESLKMHSKIPLSINPIKQNEMRSKGYYWRRLDPLASTEFTLTRFLTPFIAHYKGWAIFMDCDFLWRKDISAVMDYAKKDLAVLVVKHEYKPEETIKMDGKMQLPYPRKNWSSFMLMNCQHDAIKWNLNLEKVNRETPAYLHRLSWADDSVVGELPVDYNYLEGWSTKKDCPDPAGVHFTRGGPWIDDYKDVEYAEEWNSVMKKVFLERK